MFVCGGSSFDLYANVWRLQSIYHFEMHNFATVSVLSVPIFSVVRHVAGIFASGVSVYFVH